MNPEPPPLTADQQQALADARQRAARILSAARVATFNGWTLGIFAVLSLLFALGSVTALVMGLGLGAIAWNEFHGRDGLRAFDPAAPKRLALNQLALLGLITGYALLSMYHALTAPIPDLNEIEEMVGPVGDLVQQVMVAVYAVLIVATGVVQGLMARYYGRRTALIAEFREKTPAWVVAELSD